MDGGSYFVERKRGFGSMRLISEDDETSARPGGWEGKRRGRRGRTVDASATARGPESPCVTFWGDDLGTPCLRFPQWNSRKKPIYFLFGTYMLAIDRLYKVRSFSCDLSCRLFAWRTSKTQSAENAYPACYIKHGEANRLSFRRQFLSVFRPRFLLHVAFLCRVSMVHASCTNSSGYSYRPSFRAKRAGVTSHATTVAVVSHERERESALVRLANPVVTI